MPMVYNAEGKCLAPRPWCFRLKRDKMEEKEVRLGIRLEDIVKDIKPSDDGIYNVAMASGIKLKKGDAVIRGWVQGEKTKTPENVICHYCKTCGTDSCDTPHPLHAAEYFMHSFECADKEK